MNGIFYRKLAFESNDHERSAVLEDLGYCCRISFYDYFGRAVCSSEYGSEDEALEALRENFHQVPTRDQSEKLISQP